MNNKQMKHIALLGFLFLLLGVQGFGQSKKTLSLEECIAIARSESPSAKIARKNYEASYWSYRSFKADYLPNVSLTGNTPSFSRSIISNLQDDGQQEFVSQNFSSSFGNLSISFVGMLNF